MNEFDRRRKQNVAMFCCAPERFAVLVAPRCKQRGIIAIRSTYKSPRRFVVHKSNASTCRKYCQLRSARFFAAAKKGPLFAAHFLPPNSPAGEWAQFCSAKLPSAVAFGRLRPFFGSPKKRAAKKRPVFAQQKQGGKKRAANSGVSLSWQ